MIKRLRLKFIAINMTIVTGMLAIIFFLVLFFTSMGLELQSQQMMDSLSQDAFRPSWAQEIRRPHFVVRIGLGGDIVVLNSGFFQEMEEQQLLNYTRAALEAPGTQGTLRQHKLRFQKMPSVHGQTIIFADISSEVAAMESLVKVFALIGGLSLTLFLGISVVLARWAVRPVEEAWNQQRQFVADASHELKTPLTVIMTNAELLHSGEYDPGQQQRFAASILTMSQQMRALVESLLELARVDNGTARLVFSLVDLSGIVSGSLLDFEVLYFEKGLTLESQVEENIQLTGSAGHLRQVLDILLDNAGKYAAPEGFVRVTLRRQGSHCLLSVATPGEAIAREDLKNIFKRFYRIDKARTGGGGYGLGLAIAQSIVDSHRGKIWAESVGCVNTFFVQLPLA